MTIRPRPASVPGASTDCQRMSHRGSQALAGRRVILGPSGWICWASHLGGGGTMFEAIELTRSYFAALERGVTGDELAAFYGPEAVQEEYPNRLMPTGAGGRWPRSGMRSCT